MDVQLSNSECVPTFVNAQMNNERNWTPVYPSFVNCPPNTAVRRYGPARRRQNYRRRGSWASVCGNDVNSHCMH